MVMQLNKVRIIAGFIYLNVRSLVFLQSYRMYHLRFFLSKFRGSDLIALIGEKAIFRVIYPFSNTIS